MAPQQLRLSVLTLEGIVGRHFYCLIAGKHSGRASSWMDAVGKEVTLWQQMLDRPNFWVEASVSLRPQLETNIRLEK